MSDLVLQTPRLSLVMWEADDAALIHRLHATLATTRFMSGGSPWSMQRCQERLYGWFEEHDRHGTTKYKLLHRQTGVFIGRAGISPYGAGEFELGYALREEEWGRGYATEIATALVDWFFAKGLAARLIAFTHPENIVSQRVLTKIGMRPTTPRLVDGIQAPTFEILAGPGSA